VVLRGGQKKVKGYWQADKIKGRIRRRRKIDHRKSREGIQENEKGLDANKNARRPRKPRAGEKVKRRESSLRKARNVYNRKRLEK